MTQLQDQLDYARDEYLIDLSGNTADDVALFIDYIEELNHNGYTVNQALELADAQLGIDFSFIDWRNQS